MTLDQAIAWTEINCNAEAVARLRSRAAAAVLLAEVRRLRAEPAALKAQQGESVAVVVNYPHSPGWTKVRMLKPQCSGTPLYTAPPNTEALKDALKMAKEALVSLGLGKNTRLNAIATINEVLGDNP